MQNGKPLADRLRRRYGKMGSRTSWAAAGDYTAVAAVASFGSKHCWGPTHIMKSKPDPALMLERLLLESLSGPELRHLVSLLPNGREIAWMLPGSGASHLELSHSAAEALGNRGLIDRQLLDILRYLCPRRMHEIDAISHAVGYPSDDARRSSAVVRPALIHIEGGRFLMGSPPDRGLPEEWPQSPVTLSDYWISETTVTEEQFNQVMVPGSPYAMMFSRNCPKTGVTWYDAARYCNALSALEHRAPAYLLNGSQTSTMPPPCEGYVLPAEAQWEYACRAGKDTAWSFGDDVTSLPAHAWFGIQIQDELAPVGLKKPNQWGIHDMHGHVAEWCEDWWTYYDGVARIDPRGPEQGRLRVTRGGSSWDPAISTRSASRMGRLPNQGTRNTGFRIVLAVAP